MSKAIGLFCQKIYGSRKKAHGIRQSFWKESKMQILHVGKRLFLTVQIADLLQTVTKSKKSAVFI
jgi:hypothetical protein